MFKQILILICLINLSKAITDDEQQTEEKLNLIECNLATNTQEEPICDLKKNLSTTFLSMSKYRLPIEIQNGLIIWQNKYQPISTRWSQLCPSPYLVNSFKTSNNKCANWQTCDQDSYCMISYELNSQIKLVDNLIQDDGPVFTDDLKFINITFDLELNQEEIILIETTNKLDQMRSKQFRVKNEFNLEQVNSPINNCETTDIFTVRYDSNEERLYLKLTNKNDLISKRKQCYVVSLNVKRATSLPSQSLLQINLIDTRLDRPIFDQQVYNFTISENSPIDTIIGSVHAKYLSAKNIKYRILPFTNEISLLNKILNSRSNDQLNSVPVKINQLNGTLSLKLNLDREKYLEENLKQSSENSILRLNIEASYASTKYSYCKVNIIIEDVNDNPPIAKLSPLANFGTKPTRIQNDESNTNTTMNLYVNENTPINQILAYLAVYDPDSGENGTVKSIDLSLINFKQASHELQTERSLKLKQLKQTLNIKQIQPHVPFRLNKIGEKLYTVQLVSQLDYTQYESYTIEMTIKDNGVYPQLETKTRININVIDQNDYPPMFTHEKLVNINIDEDTKPVNQIIFKVNAIDLDDGKNGQVKYKLVNNPYLEQIRQINREMSVKEIEFEAKKRLDTTFEVNPQTGEIKLIRSLSRDSGLDGDYLDLVVMAYDNELDQYEYEEYQLDDLDDKYVSYKSLNSTCVIRIRINDKNNNKPQFETNKLNLTVHQSTTNNLKHLGSIIISDLDSYEVNSKNFLLKEQIDSIEFTDKRCQQALDLKVDNLDSAFKILIETIDTQLDQIKCKLSVWSNLNNLIQEEYDILINIRDNGDKLVEETSSNLNIHINVNKFEDENEMTTTIYELETGKSFNLVLNNTLIKMKSLFKLNEDLNLIQIDNLDFQIVNSNTSSQLIVNNLNEDGIYLLDLILNQTKLVQIKLMLHSSGESFNMNKKMLNNYNRELSSLLTSEHSSLTKLTQFEGLLLNSSLLAASSNLTALFFNNSNTTSLSQFVILISVVLLFVILVFSCCVCLLIKRKCNLKRDQNKSDQIKFDTSISKSGGLNVTDDDNGGFKQQSQLSAVVVIEDLKNYLTDESKTKVNRYLDGLVDPTLLQLPNKFTNMNNDLVIQPNQQSSPAASMSSQTSSKHTLPISSIDSIKSSNEITNTKGTLSTTSSSCMSSDEGCYGSSDFSSEINLKLKQQQNQIKSNLVTPIKQQQNYYISNLSRFEKIYNKIDSLLESPSSNLDSSTATNNHHQLENKSQKAITSISGSYV